MDITKNTYQVEFTSGITYNVTAKTPIEARILAQAEMIKQSLSYCVRSITNISK